MEDIDTTFRTNLSNCYGDVIVKERGGKFFWSLDDHSSTFEEEIPENLYRALLEFHLNGLKSVE